MQNKNKIIFYFFLYTGLLFLSVNFCFALELEVAYPHITSALDITASATVPEYLKYIFNIGMFAGFFAAFVSLSYAGVLYFLSPVMPSGLSKAKDRVSGSISGLLILVLFYLIITTINPNLSFFRVAPLQTLPPPPAPAPQPGVNLYNSNVCPASAESSLYTNSIPDLSPLKLGKQVKSVKITNLPANNIYYLAFLYENPKFNGKCLLIPYSIGCKSGIDPFSLSVDIYRASFTPIGEITIFRNSNFTPEGGYFKILSSDISSSIGGGNAYMINLDNTRFTDSGCTVPEEEQDCTQYDDKGKCVSRECPTLASKNIGSIKIDGNYFVLAVYLSPSDTAAGPWTNCQSFSTVDDINKAGPRLIRWENVFNKSSTTLPNWLIVYPIVK